MFQLYSKGCEYALHALAAMGSDDASTRRTFTARDVCRLAGTPEPFTRKMLQALAAKGILHAAPGPHGGYSLAKSPDRISVLEVVRTIEGGGHFDSCVLGASTCDSSNPCALHHSWMKSKDILLRELKQLTLADLIETGRSRSR